MDKNRKGRWGILMIFMLAHAANDGFGWVIPPLLPAIRDHFHVSYTEMGAFFTLFRFFAGFMQAPVSYLVYFVPAPALLVGGMLWSSVGMILASLSMSFTLLVWVAAISGIGRAPYHPLAVSILSRVYGRALLGRVIGLHLSASSTGQIVAPFLIVLLLERYGWRVPLLVWSSLGLVAGVSMFFFLRRQKGDIHPKEKTLNWPYFSRPLGIYILSVTVWGVVQSALMTFIPLFLVDQRGFSAGKAAFVYGMMALAAALCRPFLGVLMDRMGRRKPVIIGGFIISGLATVSLAFLTTPWILYVTLILLGIFLSGHSGLADTFMVELIPSQRREETLGFMYTLRMGVASCSPLLVGFLSERYGLIETFSIMGLVSLSSAVILAFAEEKPWAETTL